MTLTEAELAERLARHFPTTRRVAEIADVTMSSPRVWLLPERNRLGARFDLSAVERLFGRAVQGRLALDAGLRFEPADGSIRLSEVRVQQLDLGAGAAAPMPMPRLGALVAEQLLEDLPVYQLKPEQGDQLRRSGLKPGIAVTPRGVELTLAPS